MPLNASGVSYSPLVLTMYSIRLFSILPPGTSLCSAPNARFTSSDVSAAASIFFWSSQMRTCRSPPLPAAAYRDGSHTGNLLYVPLQRLVGIVRQILDGPVAPDSDPDDGLVLGADLLDHRRLGFLRQLVANGSDLVAHVLGRQIDVPLKMELHGHDGEL